jgi:hypothetical protein
VSYRREYLFKHCREQTKGWSAGRPHAQLEIGITIELHFAGDPLVRSYAIGDLLNCIRSKTVRILDVQCDSKAESIRLQMYRESRIPRIVEADMNN